MTANQLMSKNEILDRLKMLEMEIEQLEIKIKVMIDNEKKVGAETIYNQIGDIELKLNKVMDHKTPLKRKLKVAKATLLKKAAV